MLSLWRDRLIVNFTRAFYEYRSWKYKTVEVWSVNKGLIALSGSQPPRNKECSNLLKSVKRISNDTLLSD